MSGSSVAAMIVGTVFIVIFASATVLMVDSINDATIASQVELPDPEITLVSAVWNGADTLTYTITNTGPEEVQIAHIFITVDNDTPISCSGLSPNPNSDYIFPGETITASSSFGSSPARVFLVVFEYSSSVAVTA